MTKDKRIGHKIMVQRAVLRINQVELARRVGVTQGYISLMENGDRPISDELLRKISVALRCKPEELKRWDKAA